MNNSNLDCLFLYTSQTALRGTVTVDATVTDLKCRSLGSLIMKVTSEACFLNKEVLRFLVLETFYPNLPKYIIVLHTHCEIFVLLSPEFDYIYFTTSSCEMFLLRNPPDYFSPLHKSSAI